MQTVEISNTGVEVDLGVVCATIAPLAHRTQDVAIDQGRLTLGAGYIRHLWAVYRKRV